MLNVFSGSVRFVFKAGNARSIYTSPLSGKDEPNSKSSDVPNNTAEIAPHHEERIYAQIKTNIAVSGSGIPNVRKRLSAITLSVPHRTRKKNSNIVTSLWSKPRQTADFPAIRQVSSVPLHKARFPPRMPLAAHAPNSGNQ